MTYDIYYIYISELSILFFIHPSQTCMECVGVHGCVYECECMSVCVCAKVSSVCVYVCARMCVCSGLSC